MSSQQEPLMAGHRGVPQSQTEMTNMVNSKYEEQPELLDWCTPAHIRLGFIKKVYAILSAQLLLTALIAAPFVIYSAPKQFVQENPGFLILAAVLNLGFALLFSCGPEKWRRTVPINYGLLFGFTACEGFLVGCICAQYTGMSVLLAVGVTSLLVFGLTVYAFTTKSDFTSYGPYLFAACWGLFLAGMLFMIIPYSNTLHKIYAGAMLVLFSIYLIYDTQIVVGGEHRSFQLTVDDYVFGAMILYLDIIQIFLQILELLATRDN